MNNMTTRAQAIEELAKATKEEMLWIYDNMRDILEEAEVFDKIADYKTGNNGLTYGIHITTKTGAVIEISTCLTFPGEYTIDAEDDSGAYEHIEMHATNSKRVVLIVSSIVTVLASI